MSRRLTNEIERRATDYLARIDEMGGAVAAIERGYMQHEIQNAAFLYQREIETKAADHRRSQRVYLWRLDPERYTQGESRN